MRKIAGYLTKNRSEKDQKIAQSTHENGYIKPRKTFWRNSKQLLILRQPLKISTWISGRIRAYAIRPYMGCLRIFIFYNSYTTHLQHHTNNRRIALTDFHTHPFQIHCRTGKKTYLCLRTKITKRYGNQPITSLPELPHPPGVRSCNSGTQRPRMHGYRHASA